MKHLIRQSQQFSKPSTHSGTLMLIASVIETMVIFLFLSLLLGKLQSPRQIFLDSFLLMALTVPLFWWLVVRPLCRQVRTVSARSGAILGSVVDAVIHFDEQGSIESINLAAEKMFGYLSQDVIGQRLELFFPGETACTDELSGVHNSPIEDAGSPGPGTVGRRKDGSSFPVQSSVSRLELEGRQTFIAIVHDITRRTRLMAMVEEQKEFLESLVQHSAVPTFVLNSNHEAVVWNRACEEMTGVLATEMLGGREPWKAFYDIKRPVLADIVISAALKEAQGKTAETFNKSSFIPEGLQAEGWYENLNGRDRYLVFNAAPIRNSRGDLLAVVETFEDITERKHSQEQLEYQANFDGLTGLPNRNLLGDRIRQAMLISLRSRQEVAVLVLDLDNFKLINNTLGHEQGDALLKMVAERLRGSVRSGDTVAHQGGDEFTIVISADALTENAALIAGKILETIARPFAVNGCELVITGSIGISVFPKDGDDVQLLVRNAETAMYRAKEQGRNTCQFYTGEMNARSEARVALEHELRRALERKEFLVYYQPKVSLRTGRITGMEALVRWNSPDRGMVGPDTFIPLAEETGLIVPLGAWVLRTACAQNKAWQDAGLPALTVAVNLSPRQFRQQNIAVLIEDALTGAGLNPRFLELEITESMVMRDADRVAALLGDLKRLGVSLSMDDFGTGYSSLSYLKRFPFDKLKIDKSFVRDITCDPDNAAIAKAIIAMAHSIHLKVIAEGVETQGQLEYLRSHGCDEMQGYYFSRPVPALDFESLLRERRQLPELVMTETARGNTILVVDDDEGVTRSLQRLLLLDGYHVLIANSATEGFELLSLNQIDVIVSDFRMPGMNGVEFLGRVKEHHPTTVRLILTGHADLAVVTDSINIGAIYKILHKPWRDDEFNDQIGSAFRYHEMLFGKGREPDTVNPQHISAMEVASCCR